MQRDATVSFVIFRGKIIHELLGENELNELYHYLVDLYSLVLFFFLSFHPCTYVNVPYSVLLRDIILL